MSEEEKAIKNVEKFVYSILNGISAKDCKILLELYNKEKETSHYIQSQLDEANAKLIEEKEKNENLSCNRILIQENVYKEIKEKIENINNYINKNKLFELLEIDNIDVIHCRLKQILEK